MKSRKTWVPPCSTCSAAGKCSSRTRQSNDLLHDTGCVLQGFSRRPETHRIRHRLFTLKTSCLASSCKSIDTATHDAALRNKPRSHSRFDFRSGVSPRFLLTGTQGQSALFSELTHLEDNARQSVDAALVAVFVADASSHQRGTEGRSSETNCFQSHSNLGQQQAPMQHSSSTICHRDSTLFSSHKRT